MKRYFTVLALLGILGFTTISFAGASEDKQTAKEIKESFCLPNERTGQGTVQGVRLETRADGVYAVKPDGSAQKIE
ncbi:MAG TPA: hypothetical protein VJB34_01290 [Bdellovibrionota bacterium]|nr:hypothetical protein [Bdellovibrionota bacterium]